MMNYQLIVRNHRSKGLTVKQALQILLLLSVGIWLLYQIQHSHNNHQETTRSRLKLVEQHSNILGRKGTGRWSENFGYSEFYLKDVNLMAENEKKEDKESHVFEDSNIAIQVGEEDEVASKNGMLKEDFIEKETESSEGVEGNIKDPRMNKENVSGNLLKDGKGAEMEKGKSDFLLKHGGRDSTTTSVKEKEMGNSEGIEGKNVSGNHLRNGEGASKEKGKSDFSLKGDGLANNTVKDKDEKDGSQSFNDENGVPQDPNDESTQDESTELWNDSTLVINLPIEHFKRSGTSKSDSDSDM